MRRFVWLLAAVLVLAGGLWLALPGGDAESVPFAESTEALDNPDRGFYRIYGLRITDEPADYTVWPGKYMANDPFELAMLQIHLAQYSGGDISQAGLQRVEELFSVLRTTGKHLIVRCLYDWDGKNMETEPQDIDVILRHMEQLGPIFRENADIIFVMQGLFVGNHAEMHSTRYTSTEDVRLLAEQLGRVTDPSTWLAVRTPVYWRKITGRLMLLPEEVRASRLSLYNDGMLGSGTDYGTYAGSADRDGSLYAAWSREAELAFQSELCSYVPNGGEVIVDNPVNDFETAMADMARMHVTYINRDYDAAVLEKWANATVTDGVYAGMDGLTYAERHLGYRILIRSAEACYRRLRQEIALQIDLQNVGFAPLYREKELILTVVDEAGNPVYRETLDSDIRTLSGGDRAEELLVLQRNISVFGWKKGEYGIYLAVADPDDGTLLQLANTQEMTQYGYQVANIHRR